MATGSGYIAKEGRQEVDAFLSTEVELAKAKRMYITLEKRLEDERIEFSKDYRRLNDQLLSEREKSNSLQARVFELEAELHKERITRYSTEEEETTRRRVLEEELRRSKSKTDSTVGVLEEELRATKQAWAQRLAEERKAWQQKTIDRADTMQDQVEQTRDYYKAQIDQLHREMADILTTNRTTKEELELAQQQLREDKRRRKVLKMELDEAREKYRRCLNLASDLVALRKSRAAHTLAYPHTSLLETHTRASGLPRPLTSGDARDDTESYLLRKQLNLTQVLLDEELRKNRELREELTRIKL